MRLHREIVCEPFASLGSTPSDAPGRRLRLPVWIARIAAAWGFAGAVLLQAAAFGLIARLALQLDAAALPDVPTSLAALALGAFAMVSSKRLTAQRPLAS